MNHEPVAWIALNQLNGNYVAFTNHQKTMLLPHIQQMYANWKPLYTHPAKTLEPDCYCDGNVYRGVRSKDSAIQTIHIDSTAKTLTDEEILDALQDALNGWKYIRECHGDLYGVGWDRVQDKIEAILRKAQEK